MIQGMIAVSLANSNQFTSAQGSGADLLELRNDLISNHLLIRLAQQSTLPIILTLKRSIAPDSLRALLQLSNIHYVDVDYRRRRQLRLVRQLRLSTTKLILSAHNYQSTPNWPSAQKLAQQLWCQHPDVIKIATNINQVDDLVVIKRLQEKYQRRIIAIGMGELGLMTRIYHRALFTYAAAAPKRGTAPGQLTISATRSTKLYGLIGDNIQHSLSPKLHNAFWRAHHLPYRYQLWQTGNLAEFMEVFNFFQLPGASVTAPFKRAVLRYCDQLDPVAKTVGAVNTLARRGKKVIGYNTDWLGTYRALQPYWRNARVLILGNGGAAAACAYAAKYGQARSVTMLGHSALPTTRSDFNVLINATPVVNRLLIPPAALRQKIVMDCNYGQVTALLHAARRQRARLAIDGKNMLNYQAMEQFKLWRRK